MARKKKGFGRIVGGLTGSPYDRLLNQLEKLHKQHDGRALSKELNRFAKIVAQQVDEERIDEEEHDLLMEEIEDIHPDEKMFSRLGDDADDFYDSDDLPDAPELNMGGPVDLDKLLQSKGDSQGSWGSDEYEEYRQRMSEEFFRESDEALSQGDHQMVTAQDPGGGRVFHDVEDTANEVKRQIVEEEEGSPRRRSSGGRLNARSLENVQRAEPEPEDDGATEGVSVDEDGVEWWEDEDGQWWYRPPGEEDWYVWDE